MPSQLVFLVDLDQSLPLSQLDGDGKSDAEERLQGALQALKRAILRLLADRCRLRGSTVLW